MNKMFATIKSTAGTDGPGTFEATLSVSTLDRDGEIVDIGAFEPLPARINIDVDHAMSVEKTIGSGVPYYDNGVLKIKGTFASTPLGQMVRTLVVEGHIDSMSVAYMNAVYETDEKTGVPHLRKGELLNAGIVGIPANREALITASKSFVTEVAEATQAPTLCSECQKKLSPTSDTPTETAPEQTAADKAAVTSPASVDVAALTRRARVAVTALPLP